MKMELELVELAKNKSLQVDPLFLLTLIEFLLPKWAVLSLAGVT